MPESIAIRRVRGVLILSDNMKEQSGPNPQPLLYLQVFDVFLQGKRKLTEEKLVSELEAKHKADFQRYDQMDDRKKEVLPP